MRSTLTLFLALACTLFVVACWTQFDPPPEPTDDDDTSVVDDDDTSPTGCVAAATISCSDDFPANNNAPGSTDSVLSYSCSGLEFTGPEYAVQWDATTTGPASVTVSGMTSGQDLDLFVLSDPNGIGCDPASCVSSSSGTGQEETTTFDAVAGQTYYFVVDGYEGSISNFTMSLDCSPVGDDDDDDTTPADDDDTTPADDDDAAPDCDDPVVIGAVVTLTDASGALTNTLTTSDPMTVNVSVENSAGNSGTTSFTYGSPCIFNWSLWYQNGNPVSGGPTCPGAVTFQDYTCGAPAVVGTDTVSPIEGVSGNPVVPGTYDLIVETIYFGTFNFVVNVP